MNTPPSGTLYRVVGLDPGGRTGWATYTAVKASGPDGRVSYENEVWDCGELGPGDHHLDLWNLLHDLTEPPGEHLIVCESFEYRQHAARPRAGLNLVSREYIGVARLFAQQEQVRLVMQTAAQGKSFATNDKLKRLGLYRPGLPHARDAVRHVVRCLIVTAGRHQLAQRLRSTLPNAPADGASGLRGVPPSGRTPPVSQ